MTQPVALVTGASSGIGRALAQALATRGSGLVLVARRRDRLESLAAELRASHGTHVEALPCDLADAAAIDALPTAVHELGLHVETLVNNAGFGLGGAFLAQDRARVREMARVNIEAVFSLTHAFVPGMVARGRGRVLIVSSLAGLSPVPGFAAYAATKAASVSFAEALHAELKPSGVTVTALCPGPVDTEFNVVADVERTAARVPAALHADAARCAEEALAGLDAGQRVVVPLRTVRVLGAAGRFAPRGLTLPVWRKVFEL